MSGFFNSASPTNAPPLYSGLNVGTSQYNMPVPFFRGTRRLSTNAIWFNDFKKKPVDGKGKGGGAKSDQAYDYSAATALGLCEGPIDSIANIWANGSTTTTTTLTALNMTLLSGTASQAPWSFVTTNYPLEARAYAYTAYLTCPKLDLGESATIPDNAFECVALGGYSYTHPTPGWINPATHDQDTATDILLADFVTELLISIQLGAVMTSADLGDFTQWATYQRAQGLFFSPLLNSQEKFTDIIDRYAQLTNSWVYEAAGKVMAVPLGDSAITGNGFTYAPVQDVAYNLVLADFITSGPDDAPVKVSRKDPADCYNRTQADITDRTLGYIDNPFEYKDQTLVDQFGLRDNDSVQADEICDPLVAPIVVQLIGKRAAYIRKTYTFKTSFKFLRCLPGTILTLTDPNNNLIEERVRVVSVKRDTKRLLNFTCEEFPGTVGTYVAPLVVAAINPATTPNQYVLPGSVNTPAIIEPDSAFTGGVPKIIIAASGGANWGGCDVLLSFDGTSYGQIGTITNAARQGLLTASLGAYSSANPDTGHTLSVDCTESQAGLPTVTTADATALRTLSLIAAQPTASGGSEVMPVNGELLAFGDLTATGTFAADLTYLMRGQYGTAPGAHGIGDQFTAIDILGLDGTSVAYELPTQYIGQPLYLKLASFNLFDLSSQDPSTCTEYVYTPTGAGFGTATAGVPAAPAGLNDTAGSTAVALDWSANAATDNVAAYKLWRANGTGASFSAASVVWTGQTLNGNDLTVSPSTGYTYFLTAVNAAGESAPTSGKNVTTSASTGSATTQETVTGSTLTLGPPPALSWYVDIDNTSGGAITVTLPGSPVSGQIVVVTDADGNAGTDAITIKHSSTTIATISTNGGSSAVRWNGSNWLVTA